MRTGQFPEILKGGMILRQQYIIHNLYGAKRPGRFAPLLAQVLFMAHDENGGTLFSFAWRFKQANRSVLHVNTQKFCFIYHTDSYTLSTGSMILLKKRPLNIIWVVKLTALSAWDHLSGGKDYWCKEACKASHDSLLHVISEILGGGGGRFAPPGRFVPPYPTRNIYLAT